MAHKLLASRAATTEAPRFVDTLRLDFLLLLELNRRQHPVPDVLAFRIVEHLDVIEHVLTRLEEEIASLSRKVTGQYLRLSGTVRVTTLDMLAFGLLPRHLAKFRTVYPGIEVELIVGNATLNLNRREADIALRVGNAPPDTLVGRRVGRLVFAIYGSETYHSDKPGIGLEEHDWIGFDTEHAALTRRFGAFLPSAQPLLRTNSIAAAIAATKAGMGLAPLPCGLADLETDLVRVAMLPEDFTLDLWILTHEDLRQTARIRAFLDFMAEELAKESSLLEGLMPDGAWRSIA